MSKPFHQSKNDLVSNKRKPPLNCGGMRANHMKGIYCIEYATKRPAESFDVATSKFFVRNETHLHIHTPSIKSLDKLKDLILDNGKDYGLTAGDVEPEFTSTGSPFLKMTNNAVSRAVLTAIGFGDPIREDASHCDIAVASIRPSRRR